MFTQLKVQDFLSNALRGEVNVSPESISNFSKDCTDAITKQMNRGDEGYRIRMSGLGRPLCQQLLEREGHREEMEYNAIFRFLFGDLTEAVVMMMLREAGVEIVDFQRPVELEIAGHKIKGTLDVILRDELGEEKVWDIKSASEWAYKYKYTGAGGYEAIKRDDPFGYAMQGFLYAEATGLPFGGWIVVNKSSGEIAVVDVPDWCQDDKKEYLKDAVRRVKILTDPSVKPRIDFKDEFETFRKDGEDVRTGNKVLARQCGMCGFKHHCWPNAVYHDKVTSRAKNRPKTWYSRLKKKIL
tara:strand:- start:1135 stop:2028 length:894 start_codon:yes stop_codon:yes gene_type:complete